MRDFFIETHEHVAQAQAKISEMLESFDKPPIGLVPKRIKQRERFIEVCGAISRYYNAGRKIPTEWIEEYNELVEIAKSNGDAEVY